MHVSSRFCVADVLFKNAEHPNLSASHVHRIQDIPGTTCSVFMWLGLSGWVGVGVPVLAKGYTFERGRTHCWGWTVVWLKLEWIHWLKHTHTHAHTHTAPQFQFPMCNSIQQFCTKTAKKSISLRLISHVLITWVVTCLSVESLPNCRTLKPGNAVFPPLPWLEHDSA